jgi:hypothetical protein
LSPPFEDIALRAVETARVRVGFRTIVALALCAAALAAAVAHFAIDVIGDYVLAHDSYDQLQHGSRELVSGIALIVAALLAAHGLRICCEIAATNRARLLRPALRFREVFGILAGAVTASTAMVPAMEYLDGRLDGSPVRGLADAFGGSIALGIVTTVVCTALVAALVCTFARWLISHRDSIATIIETFLRSADEGVRPSGYERVAPLFAMRRRRAIHALRLAKRGPPATTFG